MSRRNVCFHGQCGIDPPAPSMIRMPRLPSLLPPRPSPPHSQHGAHTDALVVRPQPEYCTRVRFLPAAPWIARPVSSPSGSGPGAEEVTPGPLMNINERWDGWLIDPTADWPTSHSTRRSCLFIIWRRSVKSEKRERRGGCHWMDWRSILGLCLRLSDRWS